MRSPVELRGSSCMNTARCSKRGSSFSIPTTLISTSGSVVHMRPFPSDSSTTRVPVSAIAKLAPLMPTRARRNRSRRWMRAASASAAGSSDRSSGPMVRRSRSRISVRLRWMAGTRMCDDQSPSSCSISSAKSVSSASTPRAASASLSPISSVVSDFTLTTSCSPWPATMPATRSLAASASAAQCTVAPASVAARSNSTR